ncbi:MAG: hypothetical protein ABIH70_00500 [Chloroflexota bacterium]
MPKNEAKPEKQTTSSQPPSVIEDEAIKYLRVEITGGKNWYIALLETMARWNKAEETLDGRSYRYLIAGEAFDWLLLAQRLCEAVKGLLPENEVRNLLFGGTPPLTLPREKFKGLIGPVKHRQYLNYFYGITVEEALVQAVEEEVRKERWTWGFNKEHDTLNEAYRRIYGTTRAVLLRRFRREQRYPQLKSITLTELKEFTYWCFEYRFKNSDQARMASDTKKALNWLHRNGYSRQPSKNDYEAEFTGAFPATP